jgi:hypothetical protein
MVVKDHQTDPTSMYDQFYVRRLLACFYPGVDMMSGKQRFLLESTSVPREGHQLF